MTIPSGPIIPGAVEDPVPPGLPRGGMPSGRGALCRRGPSPRRRHPRRQLARPTARPWVCLQVHYGDGFNF